MRCATVSIAPIARGQSPSFQLNYWRCRPGLCARTRRRKYVAGGFNKAKLTNGKEPVGNRYVILRWDSMEAYEKGQKDGIKAWIEKNAPDAREVVAEAVEAK